MRARSGSVDVVVGPARRHRARRHARATGVAAGEHRTDVLMEAVILRGWREDRRRWRRVVAVAAAGAVDVLARAVIKDLGRLPLTSQVVRRVIRSGRMFSSVGP